MVRAKSAIGLSLSIAALTAAAAFALEKSTYWPAKKPEMAAVALMPPAMPQPVMPEIDRALPIAIPAPLPEAPPAVAMPVVEILAQTSQPSAPPPATEAPLAVPMLTSAPLPPVRPAELAAIFAREDSTASLGLVNGKLALLHAPLPSPRPAALASLGAVPLAPPPAGEAESVSAQPAPSPGKPVSLQARLAAKGFKLGDRAFIRIFKDESKLEVWMSKGGPYSLFETFPICKWSGQLGPKQVQGDYQSPEGFYMVGRKQLNPNSAYHLSFNLGYPNAYDKAHGRSGAALMVHGDCKSVGCFAMTNQGIEPIYAIVEAALGGQAEVPVHIFPFRPTSGAMLRHMFHPWRPFWANLAEGYEHFERTKTPPQVGVCNRQYVFGEQAMACQRIAAW